MASAPYTGVTELSNLIQNVHDRAIDFALRDKPRLRELVLPKPVHGTQPGSTIKLYIHGDLAAATTPLNEVTDPTGKQLSDPTAVTVTIAEYGDWTVLTKALSMFNLADALDSDAANIMARQQWITLDDLIKAKLDAGTQVITIENATLVDSERGTNDLQDVKATDTFRSSVIRFAVAKMRGDSVDPFDGGFYAGYIHPDVSHDLMAESGSVGWLVPNQYGASQDRLWAGEVGAYGGVRWVEYPRCTVTADIGNGAGSAGNIDGYNSYILGKEAIVECVADEFHTVMDGTIVDPLNRKKPIGWTGAAGWSLYRSPALWVAKTASSIGDNAA